MQISNIKKNKKLNQGFTLIELIIVIAGIAALGSFTIPGLLNSIKLGGTTIKNFIVSDEKIGYFKNELMVYGRNGMSCLKCKKKVI